MRCILRIRTFTAPVAEEKYCVHAGRVCTVVLCIVAALLSQRLSSAQEVFDLLIFIGMGTGLLYSINHLCHQKTNAPS
jgi:hypothetical protein